MNPLQIAILVYIIGMMTADFIILFYVLRRSLVTRRAIFFISSILLYMAVEAADIGYIIFYKGSIFSEPISLLLASIPAVLSVKVKDSSIQWRSDKVSSITLAFTIVLDELAMGYAFSSAFGPRLNPLISSVSNIAFGIMMLSDAIFFLSISSVKNIREFALFSFAASMAFMPNIFLTFRTYFSLVGSTVSSIIMIINIIMLYLIEIRRISFNMQLLSISLAGFDFFMMLGLSTYAAYRDLYIISISMILSMVWYFILIFYRFSDRKINIGIKYPFIFLILINLAELTMGFGESVLGFNITNSIFMAHHMESMKMPMRSPLTNPYWWIFPMNPLSMTIMSFKDVLMNSHNIIFATFWSSYILIMMTTMMPFYVIMMGAEMIYLVYERFKASRNSQVKYWAIAIMIGMPIFVWLIPYYTSFYIFGMSGMIFPVTLIGFSVSIIAIIIASTLFGKRAYCNLACMSAHMWTNIFYDKFKPKKNHRFWDYFRWIPFTLMLITFGYWSSMELGLTKVPHIGMTIINPLDVFGMFTLNYIWWFFFFLTPIFGTYSCSRQGWCGFGTFVGLFNKIIFKIKAKNIEDCRACNNIQCEKACPIKIEIRNDILSKGFSNRISCVGCGDCVEACPKNNLEIYDITSIFKKK